MARSKPAPSHPPQRSGHGLARMLSKLGYCSRSQARALIAAGRVSLHGRPARDPELRITPGELDRIEVDGQPVQAVTLTYLMLNKPRGLVTTTADEQGRATVYRCFADESLPFLSPVGRLDKASEGLLLFTNDTTWAAQITDPASHLAKVYHVQVDRLPDAAFLSQLRTGILSQGEHLSVQRVEILRLGQKNAWLEIHLEEGKNRHIRRMIDELGAGVLRLVRVQIGRLALGSLPKGEFRHLNPDEIASLARPRNPSR